MRKTGVVVMVLAFVAFAGSAIAQEEEQQAMLDWSHWVSVNPGEIQAFEQAVKDHWALHAKASDPWTWEVWQKVVGEGAGVYSIRTGNHPWADFDNETQFKGDRDHVLSEIMPHVKCVRTDITEWDPEISRWPTDQGTPKMVDVTTFHIKPGKKWAVYNAVKKINKVIVDNDLDRHYAWGWTVNGGSGTELMLVVPRNSWAEFADKDPSIWKVAEKKLGRTEVREILDTFADGIASEDNGVYVFREDLSYKPETGD